MTDLSREDFDLLRRHVLFRELDEAVLSALVAQEGCLTRRMGKGESIYTPQDFDRALGLILEGRVQVNKEGFVVSVLDRGGLFGAAALYNDREDYAVALTVLAPCRVAFFSQELMSRLMREHSAVASAYIRYLSERIRFLEGKLSAVLAPDAVSKLGQYLLERQEEDTVILDCPMSGLAKRLGLGRTSLYRAVEVLTQSGAIEKTGKRIRILKEEALL